MSSPEPRIVNERSSRHYRFGEFSLDLDRSCLSRGDTELPLRPKPFDVLTYLVQHHGRIVSKVELIEAVWPDAAVTDNSLAQCLLEIRRALDDDAQQVIRTVAKRGYLFAATVISEGAAPDASREAAADVTDARPGLRFTTVWITMATVAAAVAAAVLIGRFNAPTAQSAQLVRFIVSPPGRWTPPLMIALSPDGRHLAFVATDADGKTMLWVRDFDAVEPRVLAGTAAAEHPFWSPDSRFIGFRTGLLLKKINLSTGLVQTITDHAAGWGAAWGGDDVIVFRSDVAAGLSRVSASGGTPALVVPDTATTTMIWPHFLADGIHFVFFAKTLASNERGIFVGSLESATTKKVLSAEVEAMYAPPGYLLTVHDETLVAYPFDAQALQVTGGPLPIAEGVFSVEGAAHAGISPSTTGVVAYASNAFFNTQLAWFNRRGRRLASVGAPDRYTAQMPQISPDGRQIAIARGIYSREDIWIIEQATSSRRRFTFDPARDATPMWSRDGSRIVFQSTRGDGRSRLYHKQATGAGSEELLFAADESIHLQDWSADGRYIVYMTAKGGGGPDLWILPLFQDQRPARFTHAIGASQAQISADGKWLAYTSNATGRDEVYVESFPQGGSKHQISTEGGVMPRWRRDGRELFFVDGQQRLTAVPMRTGPSVAFGPSATLFQTDIPFWGIGAADWRAQYAPSADGQQFLINGRPEIDPPVTVVLNWIAAMKK